MTRIRIHLVTFLFWLVTIKSEVFNNVTCGSVIKLLNTRFGVRLHSHTVSYGSGSGQQSVTAVEDNIDANSLWQIKEAFGEIACERGNAITCNTKIRLFHVATKVYLHSHHYSAPLSSAFEVSGFGPTSDSGDDWTIECDSEFWKRDGVVKLKNEVTNSFLTVTGNRYHRPIAGQYEVAASNALGSSSWRVQEGIYIKPSTIDSEFEHDEL